MRANPKVILYAGLVCGTLDGLAAVVISIWNGLGPLRMFRGIASGLLGASSFRGGMAASLLGLVLHFTIAMGAAAVYFVLSRRFPVLLSSALVCGVLYGAGVHLFMTFVVIPLSAIGRRPFVAHAFLLGLLVHMIVVGPSIALTFRRFPE